MNLTHKTRRAVLAIGAAGALVVVGGGMAVASYSGVAANGQILACWKNSPASMRIVDHFPCKPDETALSWNQKGVPGTAGAAGVPGTAGAAGADGADGEAGPAGASGSGGTGSAGATGATGATGPEGPAGEVGPAGPQGDVGPAGQDGAPGEVGPQGETGPSGSAAISTSPIYKNLQGCSMYGSSGSTLAPTREGGQPVTQLGTVTQTAPGVFHLSGLDVTKSYQVSACNYGYVDYQAPRSDGTLDVVLRSYDSTTNTYNTTGMDANGVPIVIYTRDSIMGATLTLTAPTSTP